MKTMMEQPKFQQTAEAQKHVPAGNKRLNAKMVVMIEENINRRVCQLKKSQMGKQ